MTDNILAEAQNALKSKRPQKALELFNNVLTLDPENTAAYEGMAHSLFILKDFEGAIKASIKALEYDEKLVMPHVVLAESYDELNSIDKSREEIGIAYALSPKSPDVLASYGALLLTDNKIEEAILYLQQAINLSPQLYNAHYNLAVAYTRQGNHHEVFRHVAALNKIRPSVENTIRLVVAFMNQRKLFRPLWIIIFLIAFAAMLLRSAILYIVTAFIFGILVVLGVYLKKINGIK
ncbi:MAG: tetratricopeptide repeat protein [Anaerolineales bacterium]